MPSRCIPCRVPNNTRTAVLTLPSAKPPHLGLISPLPVQPSEQAPTDPVVVLDDPLHALAHERDHAQAMRDHLVRQDARVLLNLDLVDRECLDRGDEGSPERVGQPGGDDSQSAA